MPVMNRCRTRPMSACQNQVETEWWRNHRWVETTWQVTQAWSEVAAWPRSFWSIGSITRIKHGQPVSASLEADDVVGTLQPHYGQFRLWCRTRKPMRRIGTLHYRRSRVQHLAVVNNWASSLLWYVLCLSLVATCRQTSCKHHQHQSLLLQLLMMLPNNATMFTTLYVYRHTISTNVALTWHKVIDRHLRTWYVTPTSQSIHREQNRRMHKTILLPQQNGL